MTRTSSRCAISSFFTVSLFDPLEFQTLPEFSHGHSPTIASQNLGGAARTLDVLCHHLFFDRRKHIRGHSLHVDRIAGHDVGCAASRAQLLDRGCYILGLDRTGCRRGGTVNCFMSSYSLNTFMTSSPRSLIARQGLGLRYAVVYTNIFLVFGRCGHSVGSEAE